MKLATIVKISFLVSFLLISWGTYMKLTHSENAETLLSIGLFASIIFVVSAILEVRTSNRIKSAEKTMWTVALIFLSSIGALLYMLLGRKRVVAK